MSSKGNNDISIYRRYIHDISRYPNNDNIYKHKNTKHFDFILSFASEVYVHGKGTGNFHPTWNLEELDIEWVKKVKETFPHGRVIISIGGVGSEFPFDPIEKNRWIYRAIESIKWIVRDLYDNLIDGIDIHYDVIKSSVDEFSHSIGEVIRILKNENDLSINVVSIAPNEPFQSYYRNLYLQNKDIIDLVDFQFYNLEERTVEQLVGLYEKLVYEYTPTIVLPIISSHPVPIIIEFIKYLLKNNLLPGIVVWDDKNSTDEITNSFSLENVLQHL